MKKLNPVNGTENFTNPLYVPEQPGDLFLIVAKYTGGLSSIGVIAIIWVTAFNTSLFQGYRPLPGFIAANALATFIAVILFAGGYLPGQVPFVTAISWAASLALSYYFRY